ncbi:hypothetical protein AMTR_s00076p00112390 [Amborella trichopoda]|uniref:Uncharacterized protein n=1 Tax=Amborella trichopoda TaxID=13333 RepID=W1PCD4_AMBTC|nr:hypothetical protein AMTR_s00076p00112390 [Amborella trichopoda]
MPGPRRDRRLDQGSSPTSPIDPSMRTSSFSSIGSNKGTSSLATSSATCASYSSTCMVKMSFIIHVESQIISPKEMLITGTLLRAPHLECHPQPQSSDCISPLSFESVG